jgi:hypothetical protein
MSEDQNRRKHDFSMYDAMTTEALEEILRLDAEAPNGQATDGELLLYVMEVLAQRKQNSDNPGKTAQKAWESFQQHYLPSEEDCVIHTEKFKKPVRSNSPWLRRLTAAAAVIALVVCLSATANAFGWQDIWNAVAKWAKETFSFVSNGNGQDTEPAADDARQYTSFQELLAKAGQNVDMIPTWIPDGYALQDILVDETPVRKSYVAFYRKGETLIRISVQTHISSDPEKIEINENLIDIYETSGIKYYVFTNMDQKKVTWIKDSYECYISGDLPIEEIETMIESIGKG